MDSLFLKPGRDKSLLRYHPWIFSGAIERVIGDPQPGATVTVCAADGTPLALAAFSPASQIAARVWSFNPEEAIDASFFQRRLQRSLASRSSLLTSRSSALRLVNAESDNLPGLIADRYGDYLVCQFLSAGAEYWKKEAVAALVELTGVPNVYERSDVDVRAKEGLPLAAGVLTGEPPPEAIIIQEHDCRFAVDIQRGHKTGFYLDQRENRRLMTEYASKREVLNCFAYTGGFAVWALRGGALSVINADTSAPALEMARRNVALNGLDESHADYVTEDVFRLLRHYRDARRQFDLILLDPPKFAESRSQVEGATRGYKDINLLAFKLLRPGGVLFTFSCSGLITPDLFQKIVAGAAFDAERDARILQRLTQAPDHPVALSFPEGEYLKGLVCQAD